MQENLTQIEKIVIDVLSQMASGSGEAHSEEQLLAEVLKTHKELYSKQTEIGEAISSLVDRGFIIHDEKKSLWIRLNKPKTNKNFLV